jgi:hypothetical protein
MNCENCGNKHDGTYGSGRFCSSKCARGFSTKTKRKEINQKVSKKLKKNFLEIKTCPCGKTFETSNKKTYCSSSCGSHYSQLGKNKKKGIERKQGSGGLRPGGGKSKQIPYTNWLGFKMFLNTEEIEVAKILDEKKLNWDRNRKGFPYLMRNGKQRKYYPDFVVNGNKYIEYKGWVTEEMEWKMNDAVKTNNLNLNIIVGTDPRYQRFGITLKELKNGKSF